MYKTKEEILPKGTIDTYYSYNGPFKKAIEIAEHYGFHLIPPPDIPAKRTANSNVWYIDEDEKKSGVDMYHSLLKSRPHPVKVCYTLHNRRKVGNLKLEVFGCKKSIAEALVLRASLAILQEHGHKNLKIDINCRGNKESSLQFVDEFKNYYRKHAEDLSSCCQTALRNDPLHIALCDNEGCRKVSESAPRSISFLSEHDRNHFKEVLEYMESLPVPYRINRRLIGSEKTHPRTLFTVMSTKKKKDDSIIAARGERHDYLSTIKEEGRTSALPVVSMAIDIDAGKNEVYKPRKIKRNPNVYLVHLGLDAKRESLPILEDLRRQKIAVYESLMRDSLWQQMRHAETMKVKYVVIIGLQEVKERNVLVRNLETQAQESIAFSRLATFLKRVA